MELDVRCMKRSSATGRSASANAKKHRLSHLTKFVTPAQAGVPVDETLDSGLRGMTKSELLSASQNNSPRHQALILPRSLLSILMKFPACSFSLRVADRRDVVTL